MKLKRTFILCLALVLYSVAVFAADKKLSDVRRELLQDIKSARKSLGETEASISREREKLARGINAEQNRVLDLRQKAVAARRASDEETLGLGQIENRMKSWQEQSDYQSRLLAGFLERSGRRPLAVAKGLNLEEDLKLLGRLLVDQGERLYPGWHSESVVGRDGEIEKAGTLDLGPVHLFFLDEGKESGLLNLENNMNRVGMLFDGESHTGIADLYRNAEGSITFDPTLSRVLRLAEYHETLLEYFKKGGIYVIPILMFALFASVTAACKTVSLFRIPSLLPALAEQAAAAMKQSASALDSFMERVEGLQQELLQIALAPQTAEQRDELLYAALLKQRNRLERWLGAIMLTASVSPLLGLLGTISGMITTFKLMTLFGSGDANTVSAGIAEALITTELGLIVAIPALLAHALMARKVRNIFSQLEDDAVNLGQLPVREMQP